MHMHACHDMAGVFIEIHRMGVPSMSVYKRIIRSPYYRRRAYSATMLQTVLILLQGLLKLRISSELVKQLLILTADGCLCCGNLTILPSVPWLQAHGIATGETSMLVLASCGDPPTISFLILGLTQTV